MSNKLIGALIGGLIAICLMCSAGLTLVGNAGIAASCGATFPTGGASPGTSPPATATATPVEAHPGPGFTAVTTPRATWSAEQVENAAIIAAVGANEGVPTRGWVIAIATAMQESSLRNLGDLGDRNDHDSLGLFQQRPSQGWGTPEQILDPVYASGKFYAKLLTINGWLSMPLTDAAQAVQRSAYPDAYAKWEPDAEALLTAIGKVINLSAASTCAMAAALPPGFDLPPDTPQPVVNAIAWAMLQLGTPYSFGGDCTASRSGQAAHQCDCSSLVQQAYKAAGITLPRIAADQSRVGQAIDPSQIKPGDLIFIPGADGTRQNPGHVAMYLGQGLVIHAPQTNEVVKIAKYDGSFVDDVAVIRRNVGWPAPGTPS